MKDLESVLLQAPVLFRIDRAQISPGPSNPRTTFDDQAMIELRASMKARGFDPAFPIIVRPTNHVKIEHVPAGEGTLERWVILQTPFCYDEPTAREQWEPVTQTHEQEEVETLLRRAARFEIAAGERRFRAAGDVGITEVICAVRALTDCQMLEVALLENVQKESLTPLDEARGYANLVALYTADGHTKRTEAIAKICVTIGRDASTVAQAISLCRLIGELAGEALARGELPVFQARMIARLPSREMRDEVTRKVLKNPFGPSPMPGRDLQAMITADYSRELRGATFDPADADLVAVETDSTGDRIAGGACTDCPHNTRNQEQQSNGSRFHFCTNTACYRAKTAAAHEKWRALAVKPEQGLKALAFEDNARLWDATGTKLAPHAHYVELSEPPAPYDLKADAKTDGAGAGATWKSLSRGQSLEVILARDDKGRVHELAKHDAVIAAALANGHDIFRGAEQAKTPEPEAPPAESRADVIVERIKRDESDKEAALKAAREKERERRHTEAEFLALLESAAVTKLPEAFDLLATDALIACADEHSEAVALATRHGFTKKDPKDAVLFLKQRARAAEPPFRSALLVELMLHLYLPPHRKNVVPIWAKEFGADLKAARKRVDAAMKAEDAAKKEEEQLAAGLEWKSQKEKPEDFRWNSNGLCDNPDRVDVALPAKVHASVSVGRTEKGWHVGWFADGAKWGGGETVNCNGTAYNSRTLALRTGLLSIAARLAEENAPQPARERVAAYLEQIKKGKGSK